MKQPLFFLVALAAIIAMALGAAAAREQILKTKLALKDGKQDVRVEYGGASRVYRISTTGMGFACNAVQGQTLVPLKAGRIRAMPAGMDCSCGTKCWLDREAKMSICVCRSCGNSGGWIEIESMSEP